MAGRSAKRSGDAGITHISVTGYKSLRTRQEIAIRPLTVIAGANSSGKSSAIQPLLLLKQTLDAPYDPGPLQLSGANVDITAVEQVLSRPLRGQEPTGSFTVGITAGGKEITLTFGKGEDGNLRVKEMVGWFYRTSQSRSPYGRG